MTTIRTMAKVGEDGTVVVPVGVEAAGEEVDVLVTPARAPLSPQEYVELIDRTAGSITDPTFVRPPQWDVREREPLD